MLAATSSSRGATTKLVGDVLFLYQGANPAGTLEPVLDAYATRARHGVSRVTSRPSARGLMLLIRHVRHIERMLDDLVRDREARIILSQTLYAAARSIARADAILDEYRPRLVVLASQHAPSARAFIHSARRRAIPSAYIPHAPVADAYHYRDMPTDFAGLRGPREVAFYRELIGSHEVGVVGNPQVFVRVPDHLQASAPIVFAPTPDPYKEIDRQVGMLHDTGEQVVVSEHPRMRDDARYARLWPASWHVHAGRTVELFRTGTPCVVQHSSGVAWEALAHGIPVIELCLGGESPRYPLIREPYVRMCHDTRELQLALSNAREEAKSEGMRSRLIDWASGWCQFTGTTAIAHAVEFIESWRSEAVGGPLFDYWIGRAPNGRTTPPNMKVNRGQSTGNPG
jgi:hypothetical protein